MTNDQNIHKAALKFIDRFELVISVGQIVRHPVYGDGVVLKSQPTVHTDGRNDALVAVKFSRATKKFVESFANLKVVG